MPSQFFGMQYENHMTDAMLSPKRKLLKQLFSKFVSNDISWSNTDIKTLIHSSLKSFIDLKSNRTISYSKSYSKRDISVKSATSSIDSALCFWSAMSKFLGFRLTYVLQPFAGWGKKQLTSEEKALFS